MAGEVLTSIKSKNFTVKPRPTGLAFGVGAGCRACPYNLTMGTGPGPEGSRPTVEYWRSQGCGVETGFWITGWRESCDRKACPLLNIIKQNYLSRLNTWMI